ncbi:MAG: UvrD-helicase domain-containing protein, partial [Bradyrhizobium sp.]|nr:UvrD-helicase domain-containing protein [Bradyrhizobium sp.]
MPGSRSRGTIGPAYSAMSRAHTIMELNPRQAEAVEHGDGALLVLAGAGSGKTRVLVHRIARLIDEGAVEPWQILAVTFTNKAARELVERCQAIVGPRADELWVGTFHGIAARMCRRHADELGYPRSFTIFDQDDQIRLLKELVKNANLDADAFPAEAIRAFIDRAKNEARGPADLDDRRNDTFGAKAVEIYGSYQRRLKQMGAMDFGDLILNTVVLLRTVPAVREGFQRRFRH